MHTAVIKDLLDGYKARMRELLDDPNAAAGRGFVTRQAEAAAQAAGSWQILRDRFVQDRGAAAGEQMTTAVDDVARAAAEGDEAVWKARLADVVRALEGFTAAPFTQPGAARRARQLLRFLVLVPVEYDRGVSGTRVTLDFEIEEAVAFRTGAAAAFTDLKAQLTRRHPAATAAIATDLERLRTLVAVASERKEGGADGRVRPRPDRPHARPDGGRRRRRGAPQGRAGAPGGVRVLRVRPRAAAEGVRPGLAIDASVRWCGPPRSGT